MKTTTKMCEICGVSFAAPNVEINRGHGRFCSLSCGATHNNRKRYESIDRSPNVTCAQCGKKFYKKPSRAGKSKSDYCSIPCKNEGSRKSGPGISSGKMKVVRRKTLAGLERQECFLCGYHRYPKILVVHHVNGDRSDNSESNLAVICPNCHAYLHYVRKSTVSK